MLTSHPSIPRSSSSTNSSPSSGALALALRASALSSKASMLSSLLPSTSFLLLAIGREPGHRYLKSLFRSFMSVISLGVNFRKKFGEFSCWGRRSSRYLLLLSDSARVVQAIRPFWRNRVALISIALGLYRGIGVPSSSSPIVGGGILARISWVRILGSWCLKTSNSHPPSSDDMTFGKLQMVKTGWLSESMTNRPLSYHRRYGRSRRSGLLKLLENIWPLLPL